MSDNKFLDGLFVKKPNQKAPSFIKAKVSMKREEVIQALQRIQDDWVNLDIKESRDGKWYAQIDDWKPTKNTQEENDRNQNELNNLEKAQAEDTIEYPDDEINLSEIPF